MGQESKWANGQNGPRLKMGYCSLPPERVELTLNSKKETNGRVKMRQESNRPKVKMGCCCLPPLKESN